MCQHRITEMAKDGNNGRKSGQDKKSKCHPRANEQTRVARKGMAEAAPRTEQTRVTRKGKRDRAPRTTNIQSLPRRGLPMSTAKRSSVKTTATQKESTVRLGSTKFLYLGQRLKHVNPLEMT